MPKTQLKFIIKKSYEQAALSYDAYRLPWIKGSLGYLEGKILSRLVKPGSILEVGIGTGRIARFLIDNHEYFGIDLSSSMLQIARKKYGLKLNLILADAESMCFKENTFDNIIAAKVFKLLDPAEFLNQAWRVLKKNGRILILAQVRDSLWMRLAERFRLYVPTHENRYFSSEVIRMLKQAGFKSCAALPAANIVAGVQLFIWYLFYPIPLLRRLLRWLVINPVFTELLASLDKLVPSRFIVAFLGIKA